MVNVKQNKVEDRPYGLFCVSFVAFFANLFADLQRNY